MIWAAEPPDPQLLDQPVDLAPSAKFISKFTSLPADGQTRLSKSPTCTDTATFLGPTGWMDDIDHLQS